MFYGGVSLAEYEEMDYLVAGELAKRLMNMEKMRTELYFEFHTQIAKAIIKSNGAKVF